jgi:hypothetical protein
MRAVAIAAPGNTFHFSLLAVAMIAANPPKKAISTSQIAGVVRASSSECASLIGLTAK